MKSLRKSLKSWFEILKKVRAVVIDTSYLLPFFGVKVEGIEIEELYELLEMLKNRGIEIVYPKPMLVELLAKLFREAEKKSLKRLPEYVWSKLRALLVSGEIVLEDLAVEDVEVVEKLRLSGFRDLFDCIAYAIAKRLKGILLTMDRTFKNFISAIGEDVSIVKDHNELRELVERYKPE